MIEKIIYDNSRAGLIDWAKWDACFLLAALAFSTYLPLKTGFDQIGFG